MSLPKIEPGQIGAIPLAAILPDPNQPRVHYDKDSLAELAASIKAQGVLQPILVRHVAKSNAGGVGVPAHYEIVSGERRWRAAKLAKMKSIPCILADKSIGEGVGRAAAQIAENVHRAALSVMEIATFLSHLQQREGKTPNELQAALAKLGHQHVTRARIEKLVKFTLLPEWAQERLQDGTMSESHAVHLLPCLDTPAVLALLKKEVDNAINWRGQVTVRELQGSIDGAYRAAGVDLNAKYPEDKVRAFPIETCKGCEHLRKLGSKQYCMAPAEFAKKQKQALDLRAEKEAARAERRADKGEDRDNPDPTQVKPRKLKTHAGGVVAYKGLQYDTYKSLNDAKFDVATCDGCPHKMLASYNGDKNDASETCFHLPCFAVKQRTGRRDELHTEKLEAYLDEWLRPKVLSSAPARMTLAQYRGLVLWLATGAPHHGGYQRHGTAAATTKQFLHKHKLRSLPETAVVGGAMFVRGEAKAAPAAAVMDDDLARCAIATMDAPQLRWLARSINFELLTEGFVIDMTYLNLQRRSALLTLAEIGKLEHARGSVQELKDRILNSPGSVKHIGVPADVAALYAREYKPDLLDDDEYFEGGDDDDPLSDVDDVELANALQGAEDLATEPEATPAKSKKRKAKK